MRRIDPDGFPARRNEHEEARWDARDDLAAHQPAFATDEDYPGEPDNPSTDPSTGSGQEVIEHAA